MIQNAAPKILRNSNQLFNNRILQLKHFSHFELHSLKYEFNFIVKTLKNIVITETLETSQNENFSVINQKMKHNYENEMTIDDPTLSFENSQDIVINTIKSIISENENIIKIDSAKYTQMMLFILANLFASNHPIGSSIRFSKNPESRCTAFDLFHSDIQDLLVGVMNIYTFISTEENKENLLPILESFRISRAFKNIMGSMFLDGSNSSYNSIKFIGNERRHDIFFVPVVVIGEISGTESRQNTLQNAAPKILRNSNSII
jgi:hypothetical protein